MLNGAAAIVDYAHNCNSLRNILNNAGKHSSGKIITVTGVTGDRLTDAAAIGKLCRNLSDLTYFTSDNPLGVNPGALFKATAKDAGPARWATEPDREPAIAKGINQLNSGDVLLIRGRRYEQYLYINQDKACPVS